MTKRPLPSRAMKGIITSGEGWGRGIFYLLATPSPYVYLPARGIPKPKLQLGKGAGNIHGVYVGYIHPAE